MDVNKLMYALDNENNEGIINLTSKKILEMNLNIIKELHLDKSTTLNYLKKPVQHMVAKSKNSVVLSVITAKNSANNGPKITPCAIISTIGNRRPKAL